MEAARYPDLEDMIKGEGLCPICLMGTDQMPTYECENGHTMCHRCKPYYYDCSTCNGPLTLAPPPETDPMKTPPPIHFMPHPMPRNSGSVTPSAPHMDFLDHERGLWGPPPPAQDQHLACCQYAQYGCWIKFPEFLRDVHETRCQFRPYLEEEHMPNDLTPQNALVPCTHSVVGCDVMLPPWRQPIHEPLCVFKERYEGFKNAEEEEPEPEPEPENDGEDPDELVECKLKIYGCLVKMKRRRKEVHEEKCNYRKYYKEEDFQEAEDEPEEEEEEEEEDPESQVDCCWAEQGCRIRPKLYRKQIHEDKCNYKLEECSYKENGCEESFIRARRFTHELSCEFKN